MRYLVPGFMLCFIGCYTPMRRALQPVRYIDVQALGEVKTEPDIADIRMAITRTVANVPTGRAVVDSTVRDLVREARIGDIELFVERGEAAFTNLRIAALHEMS